jgi:hypothetical protein
VRNARSRTAFRSRVITFIRRPRSSFSAIARHPVHTRPVLTARRLDQSNVSPKRRYDRPSSAFHYTQL